MSFTDKSLQALSGFVFLSEMSPANIHRLHVFTTFIKCYKTLTEQEYTHTSPGPDSRQASSFLIDSPVRVITEP